MELCHGPKRATSQLQAGFGFSHWQQCNRKGKSKGKEQAWEVHGYMEGGCVNGFLGKALSWLGKKQGNRAQARSTHCLPHLYKAPQLSLRLQT